MFGSSDQVTNVVIVSTYVRIHSSEKISVGIEGSEKISGGIEGSEKSNIYELK